MRRVTRPSGVVAAAVWDFAGGLVYQRMLWDTAAALDPDAEWARGRHFSIPLTGPDELVAAFNFNQAAPILVSRRSSMLWPC
jgi:hypothetical protein